MIREFEGRPSFSALLRHKVSWRLGTARKMGGTNALARKQQLQDLSSFCLQKIAMNIHRTIQDSSIKPSKYSGIWGEWPGSDTVWLEKIEMYSAAEQQVRKPRVRGWFCGKHHGPFRLLKSYGENVQDPRISCERTFNCLGLS